MLGAEIDTPGFRSRLAPPLPVAVSPARAVTTVAAEMVRATVNPASRVIFSFVFIFFALFVRIFVIGSFFCRED
jgi:hypothetical protein